MAKKQPVSIDVQGSREPTLTAVLRYEESIRARLAATLRQLPTEATSAFEACVAAIDTAAHDGWMTTSNGRFEPGIESYVRRQLYSAGLDLSKLSNNDRRSVVAAALGYIAETSGAAYWLDVAPERFARLPALVTTMLNAAEWFRNPAVALVAAGDRALSASFRVLGTTAVEPFRRLESKIVEFIGSPGQTSELNSLRSAILTWCRALGSMDEEQRQISISTLLVYLSELRDAQMLSRLHRDALATVVSLVGRAVSVATVAPDVFVPPPLFADRERLPEGRLPTAIEYFKKHWAPMVATGRVFGDDLKDADLKLYQALTKHQSRHGASLSDLIPPSPTRGRLKHIRSEEERNAHLREAENARATRYRRRKKLQPGGD